MSLRKMRLGALPCLTATSAALDVMRHSQVQEEKAVLLNYLFLNVDSLIFRSPSLEELLTGKATFLCQI